MLIVGAFLTVNKASAFPGWWALLPTLGAFLIISAHPSAWVNRYLLGNRILVAIGLISYPLYLWHWVILAFLHITNSGVPSLEHRILGVGAAFLLAGLTYWLIEKPIRKSSLNKWIVSILLGSTLIVAGIGLNTYLRDGLGFRLMQISPGLIGIKPDKAKDWRLDSCFLNLESERFSEQCLEAKKPLIFLWGDSHAAALYPGFKHFQNEYGYGLAQFTTAACKPLLGDAHSTHKACQKINDENLIRVKQSNPEFVVLHANWIDKNELEPLHVTIVALQKLGIKNIILIGPDPEWNDDLPRVVFSYYRKAHQKPPLRMKDNNALTAQVLDDEMRYFAELHQLIYISSLDILCNLDGCLTRTSENSSDITALDNNHLTPQASIFEIKEVTQKLFHR